MKYKINIYDTWAENEVIYCDSKEEAEIEMHKLCVKYIIQWKVIDENMVYICDSYAYIICGERIKEFILETEE